MRNVILVGAGGLVIGFLSQLADARGVFTAESRVLIFIGILGGFTTFSAFGNETMNLLRDGENVPALFNIGAHIIFALRQFGWDACLLT